MEHADAARIAIKAFGRPRIAGGRERSEAHSRYGTAATSATVFRAKTGASRTSERADRTWIDQFDFGPRLRAPPGTVPSSEHGRSKLPPCDSRAHCWIALAKTTPDYKPVIVDDVVNSRGSFEAPPRPDNDDTLLLCRRWIEREPVDGPWWQLWLFAAQSQLQLTVDHV